MALKFLIALTIAGGGFLFANSADAATIIPDRTVINEHITWTKANSPYVVSGLMLIQSGGKLVIEPGTVVKSHFGTRIANPGGILEAVGTLEEPIVFTSIADDTIAGDTNGDLSASAPNRDDWNGISLTGGTGSRLEHVQVRYAVNCINIDSPNVVVKNTTVQYCNNGIGTGASFQGTVEMNTAQFNSVGISGSHIKNIIFKNNTASDNVVGFFVEDFFGGGIILENNDITRNNFGIRTVGQGVTVVNNNIYENHILGALVFSDSSVLEASGNWWGDASGPLNVTGNPDGLGNGASDWINFEPWLTEPGMVLGEQTGKRPMLIVPGIMGTEVFKGEEKLWPDGTRMLLTNNDKFMDPLAFQDDGTPLDNSLSMGQVVSKELTLNYTELLKEDFIFQGYTEGVDLFTFPYDWRQDLHKIAMENLTGQIDSILNQTEVGRSAGKIDIIAHSQGGLVVKRLLFDDPSYQSKINQLIFVGTPHLGAPKAAKVLLYGDSMDVKFLAFGLDPAEVKKISQNMPSVYQLLPSFEYIQHGQQYLGMAKTFGPLITGYSLLNYPDTKQALKNFGLNSTLIDRAENFHSHEYDNYDFNSSGILTHNIMGCQEGTIAQILAGKNGRYWLTYGPGDGTVPLISASNVFGTNEWFAKKGGHGDMMTQNGVRQLIINLISGSTLSTGQAITSDPRECKYNGKQVSVHSPVELHIYDENGNHVGPRTDGNIDLEIPGVQYDIIESGKFAFLPDGHEYTLKLVATEYGEVDFYSTVIENGIPSSTAFYASLPITNTSLAEIELNNDNDQVIILDGQAIVPSALLSEEDLKDLINPITTACLTGTTGQPEFYRSDVGLALYAIDPIMEEGNASGILKTLYSLDGGETFNEYIDPFIFSEEGEYEVLYYSIDKRGNREDLQQLSFVIDKTAPEISIE